MPLKRGKSQHAIAKNIGTLISEGYPRDQAAAIAYDYAKRANKGKKKGATCLSGQRGRLPKRS